MKSTEEGCIRAAQGFAQVGGVLGGIDIALAVLLLTSSTPPVFTETEREIAVSLLLLGVGLHLFSMGIFSNMLHRSGALLIRLFGFALVLFHGGNVLLVLVVTLLVGFAEMHIAQFVAYTLLAVTIGVFVINTRSAFRVK